MKRYRLLNYLIVFMLPYVFVTAQPKGEDLDKNNQDFNWDQLAKIYECPDWYVEGKLGIWTHWGPQTHPLRGGGWYARHMYQEDVGRQQWGKDAYAYHNERFGHPSEVGYKEVLNDWKTPNLDTDALLKYFKEELGAKYFVAMANHHDHFDNWDSTHHPWNSVDVGPKRDLVGEFAASTRKVGLPFGVSSHDDRYLSWWLPAFGSDKSGPKKGVPYDGHLTKADGKGKWWEGLDPADLYGLPPEKRTPEWIESVKQNWLKRHLELVEKYDLDLLWFDGHNFPYGKVGEKVGERLHNNSLKKHGKINTVLAGKPYSLTKAQQKGWVKDFERGVPHEPLGRPWQSITTYQTWFYKQDEGRGPRHNARTMIEYFSDVLSKGGNFLLNVELTSDGSFPKEQKADYDAFGAWVRLNADAIYGSTYWKVTGDNFGGYKEKTNADETDLTQLNKKSVDFNERTLESPSYPHEEVRYTVRGDKLYIFVLNPKVGTLSLPTLGLNSKQKPGKITALRMLGGGDMNFSQDKNKLQFEIPSKRPSKFTLVFELSGAI